MLIYAAAAVFILACAGCGWTSGSSFRDEFDPRDKSPVTAVKKWFKSMEWIEGEDAEGKTVRNPDNGRDFELYLEVINPEFLQDGAGQFVGMEQVDSLREMWNSKEWEIEFLDVQMEETANDGGEATVTLTGGGVRYIGKEMFGSPEYKQDSFGDKGGEIYLRWYEDSQSDPLLNIPGMEEVAGKGRWVVVGGLDLSEEEPWGKTPQLPRIRSLLPLWPRAHIAFDDSPICSG